MQHTLARSLSGEKLREKVLFAAGVARSATWLHLAGFDFTTIG